MSWIYHLAPAARWRDWPEGQAYLPAEFAADGFVHCTAGEDVMLKVANAFYRAVPGEFVLLTIDPARRLAQYEARAVHDQSVRDHLASRGGLDPGVQDG